jgi:hypothetical protein
MSNTPETDAFIEALNDDWDYEFAALTAHAKKLERERDEARIQYHSTLALAEALANTQIELKKERDEANAQMCQAIGYLSTIAEDCEAWLNGESDEPSMDFIKAVRDYARKAI